MVEDKTFQKQLVPGVGLSGAAALLPHPLQQQLAHLRCDVNAQYVRVCNALGERPMPLVNGRLAAAAASPLISGSSSAAAPAMSGGFHNPYQHQLQLDSSSSWESPGGLMRSLEPYKEEHLLPRKQHTCCQQRPPFHRAIAPSPPPPTVSASASHPCWLLAARSA